MVECVWCKIFGVENGNTVTGLRLIVILLHMYGADTWTFQEVDQKCLESFEITALHRCKQLLYDPKEKCLFLPADSAQLLKPLGEIILYFILEYTVYLAISVEATNLNYD
jgi:hypothetical protein